MSLFYPDYSFRRIYEIPTRFFLEQGIRVLFLDVDNTLTTHDNPVPHERIKDWMEEDGRLYIVFLFKTDRFYGELKSSDEGKVFWTQLDALPQMPVALPLRGVVPVF